MAKKKLTSDDYPVLASITELAELDVPEDVLDRIQALSELVMDEEEDDFMVGGGDAGWRPTEAKVLYGTTSKDTVPRAASEGDIFAPMRVLAKKDDREIWKIIPIAAEATRIYFPDYGSGDNIVELPLEEYKALVPEEEKQRVKSNGAPYWNQQYTIYCVDTELSDVFMVRFNKTAAKYGRKALAIIKSLNKKYRRTPETFAIGMEVLSDKSSSGQEYHNMRAIALKATDEVQPPYMKALVEAIKPHIQQYIVDRHQGLSERYRLLEDEAATFTSGGSIAGAEEQGFEDDM